MKEKIKQKILGCLIIVLIFSSFGSALAHRSGCHRWHSCPSDSGSYTCGDLGYPCRYPTYPASGGVIYPPSYTPTPTVIIKVDSIKQEIEKVRLDYYNNHHLFRERLIARLVSSLGATQSQAAYYVYTMLPDVK